MTQQNGEPQPGGGFERGYALAGDGLQITYNQVSYPDSGTTESLSYQGPDGKYTLTSSAYHFQKSDLGMLLSMTLPVSQVTGEEIKLIVLLPGVYRPHGSGRVPIQTLAIRTSSFDPANGPPAPRQVQTYQVYHLEGTDSFILFQ